MEILIYSFHVLVAVALILVSIARTRDVLHPYTLFTVVIVALLMSDFAIRGYAIETVGDVSFEYLYELQVLVIVFCLAACALAFWFTAFPTKGGVSDIRVRLSQPLPDHFLTGSMRIAWLILVLEILKRLHFSDWSIVDALVYSFGPRGTAPWLPRAGELGNLGDERAFLLPSSILMPLAGMFFGYVMVTSRRRVSAFGGLLFTTVLLVSEGSRTPVVAVLGATGLFVLLRGRATLASYFVLSVIALSIALATSLMYFLRAEGFVQLLDNPSSDVGFAYNQDDNYRQALLSFERAISTPERWDPWRFAYAVVAHPIPRAVWERKPALLADYWGNYKNEWTTTSFVGELVAMFGLVGGLIASLIVAICVYVLLRAAHRLLAEPGGIILYLLIALYGYMVLRSLLNISQFAYLPAAAFVVHWLLNRRSP